MKCCCCLLYLEEDNRAVYPKQDSPSADYTADQPLGYMTWSNDTASLPGYERRGTIIIKYIFPPGMLCHSHAVEFDILYVYLNGGWG